MDIMSTLRADVFRSVVTIIIPGATAVSPFLAVAAHRFPQLGIWVEQNAGVSGIVLLLVAVAAGPVLEELGAVIESEVWDRCLNRKNAQHLREWREYLRLAFEVEPVGHEYLRTLTLGLKFELNSGVSVFFSLLGIVWFNRLSGLFSRGEMYGIGASMLVLMFYLLWESKDSCKCLARVRHELLKGVNVGGRSQSTKNE